ncbi:MAG TPA: phage major capsid protein [Verrucomicrobiae bacterium]|jgi:HK97 family phage major capsid protein|nr:phage major capsid protein [Verrucomicrobiae bacterium]
MAELLFRNSIFGRDAVDEKNRRVTLAFSSEEPVSRGTYDEVLSHRQGDYDFSRLANSAPLLLNHDPDQQIGVVESAIVENDGRRKVGRAVVRFGKGKLADEVFQDVADGIRKHVSVGYAQSGQVSGNDDDKKTIRFAWMPYEISMATIPADETVGVGRSQITVKEKCMIDTKTEIPALADGFIKDFPHCQHEILTLKARALCGQLEFEQYRKDLLDLCGSNPRPKQYSLAGGAELGMSRKEITSYSFQRAFLSMADNKGKPSGCFEAEVSQQVERNCKVSSEGFIVPMDLMLGGSRRDYYKRDMSVGLFGGGGALVETTVETPVIEVLRNRTVCMRLGALVLAGLSGNVAIPRQTSTVTPYSLPEAGPVSTSNPTLDQIGLTPHRISSQVVFSRQLLIQSSADIEGLIRDDSMKTVGVKIDWMALNGGNGPDECVGILNQPGVGSLAFGGAPTWSSILAFEASLGALNADRGRLGYIANSNVRYVLKQTAKLLIGASTVVAMPIWENPGNIAPDEEEVRGLVNGYTALVTNSLNGQVVFGNWQDLIIGMFGGMDVIYDPYTKAGTGQNVFTLNCFLDTALRHAQSFCVSTDSGAQ